MEKNKKEGYLAGGVFLLVGILMSVVGLDQGWNNGKITIIIGAFFLLAGGGSIWKPESIGQVLAYYLERLAKNQEGGTSQYQQGNKNSTQAKAKRDVNITNYYDRGNLPEERESDEKRELIKEINQDLTKEKPSKILIKCIRLATLIGSENKKKWLEKEALGFDRIKEKKVKKNDIPKYRIVDAKIRIAAKNSRDYETINLKIGLVHPIFQIEGWIDDYKSESREMILTGPASETFKKIHRDVIGKDLPKEDVPYILQISELKKILNGLKIEISRFVNTISEESKSKGPFKIKTNNRSL
jgi:hypothetical protein